MLAFIFLADAAKSFKKKFSAPGLAEDNDMEQNIRFDWFRIFYYSVI